MLAIDDNQIVYVCGHNTVLYNTESKTYRFIQGKEETPGAKNESQLLRRKRSSL